MTEQDREFSKSEIGDLVQKAFELCATCSHGRAEHEGGRECAANWYVEGEKLFCRCYEFWPMQTRREDGYPVLGYEVSFGGSLGLALDRRLTAELWERLKPGRSLKLTLTTGEREELVVLLQVESKGFKLLREKGDVLGLAEVRKLKVDEMWLDRVDGGEA